MIRADGYVIRILPAGLNALDLRVVQKWLRLWTTQTMRCRSPSGTLRTPNPEALDALGLKCLPIKISTIPREGAPGGFGFWLGMSLGR